MKVRGVAQDEKQEVEWIRQAAKQRLPKDQYILGRMYGEGKDVTQDGKLAAEWYRKAADLGEAQVMLGVIYEQGKGVTQDEKLAAQW